MEQAEQDDLTRRLAELKLRLRNTTDPAAATIFSNDIADIEARLRAARSARPGEAGAGTPTP